MNENRVRVFRVFVSSPGDVGEERNALDNVVAAINHTDGQRHGFRLELFKWERDATLWLGPGPQPAVDAWTPEYDVYLGIMSTRFGTPTERAGSGTEDEFNAALERWRAVGAPWILFYFDVAPESIDDEERYAQLGQVLAFRKKLDKLGLVARYQGVEGGNWPSAARSCCSTGSTRRGIWNSLMRRATFRPTLEHLEQMAIRVAEVLGQVGTLRYDPARLDRQWISIPACRFWMGAQSGEAAGRNSDPEAESRESPVREMELSAFHIARFPVTVGQYRRFVESDGYVQSRFWTAGGLGHFTSPEAPQHPVRVVRGRLPLQVPWVPGLSGSRSGLRAPSRARARKQFAGGRPVGASACLGRSPRKPSPKTDQSTTATPQGIRQRPAARAWGGVRENRRPRRTDQPRRRPSALGGGAR